MRFVAPSRKEDRAKRSQRRDRTWIGWEIEPTAKGIAKDFASIGGALQGGAKNGQGKGLFGLATCYDWVAFFCGREEPALFSLSPASSEEEDW